MPTQAADLVYEEVDAELEGMRAEWMREDDEEYDPFHLQLRGGYWTATHLGAASNCAGCFARNFAKVFCARFQWPKQRTFAYNKYTQEGSVILAREWMRRSNFFFNAWCESVGEETFSEPSSLEVPENFEFIEWACAQDEHSETWTQIQELRRAVPRKRL